MTSATYTQAYHQPNQDNYLIDNKLKLFGVFDGVGGAVGGAVAAKIAAETILRSVKKQINNKEISEILKNALVAAAKNIEIDGQIYGRLDECTTATVVKISDNIITIANVGDSRCYGLTKADELKRLTIDHGLLEELIRSHQLTLDDALKIDQAKDLKELANEELLLFNQRHIITTALATGFEEIFIDFNEADLAKFKILVLTTDGVHDNLTDEEIEKEITKSKTPAQIAKKIVEAALKVSCQNTLRSKPDDITAVVVSL